MWTFGNDSYQEIFESTDFEKLGSKTLKDMKILIYFSIKHTQFFDEDGE